MKPLDALPSHKNEGKPVVSSSGFGNDAHSGGAVGDVGDVGGFTGGFGGLPNFDEVGGFAGPFLSNLGMFDTVLMVITARMTFTHGETGS